MAGVSHIGKLIAEGEHRLLDFKVEISDPVRIARSMAAFANGDGGRLLIGVRDDGSIAGVKPDEETFMIIQTALKYCKPAVQFRLKKWEIGKKTVLECIIEPGKQKPCSAPDKNGKMRPFIRQNAQVFPADEVQIKAWKRTESEKSFIFSWSPAHRSLMQLLHSEEKITVSAFQMATLTPGNEALDVFADLLAIGLIQIKYTEQENYFCLTNPEAL